MPSILTGYVTFLQEHRDVCRFEEVKCPNSLYGCKEIVARQEMEDHLNLKCQHKPVMCRWCGENVENEKVNYLLITMYMYS